MPTLVAFSLGLLCGVVAMTVGIWFVVRRDDKGKFVGI